MPEVLNDCCMRTPRYANAEPNHFKIPCDHGAVSTRRTDPGCDVMKTCRIFRTTLCHSCALIKTLYKPIINNRPMTSRAISQCGRYHPAVRTRSFRLSTMEGMRTATSNTTAAPAPTETARTGKSPNGAHRNATSRLPDAVLTQGDTAQADDSTTTKLTVNTATITVFKHIRVSILPV